MPIILPTLQRSGALQRLCALQSGLDRFDISYLAQRFANEYRDSTLFDRALIPEPSSEELHRVVNSYLTESDNADSRTLRDLIIAYSLSATFKDCSIFITCPLTPNSSHGWDVMNSETSVKVIDLDLKPIKNMRKWYDLDEQIWRYWYDTHQDP